MSAYLVEPDHIGVIAQFAAQNECGKWGDHYNDQLLTAEQFSDCLAKANIKSIKTRYPDDDSSKLEDKIYLGLCRDSAKKSHGHIDLLAMAALVKCLEYQSCEPDDWYQSKAFKVLTSIREIVLRKLIEDSPAKDVWGYVKS